MDYANTLEAARALGISHFRLSRAVWLGRVPPPAKGPAAVFCGRRMIFAGCAGRCWGAT